MSKKPYTWADGAELLPHTEKKLQILGAYFEDYLRVRCRLPQQSRFRIAVVDGFAGAGRYQAGEPGSPIILVETLVKLTSELNVTRAADGMAALAIECYLVLNDANPQTVGLLRQNMAPVLAKAATVPNLQIRCEFLQEEFETCYPKIRSAIQGQGFRNVLFNLDQCGHSLVSRRTIDDILASFRSSEIFLTFMIKALLAFLKKDRGPDFLGQVEHLGLSGRDIEDLDEVMSNQSWLGVAERIVFESFSGAANFVSPFSLHNPDGWRYWLIHFAQQHRARQVYNDILHRHSNNQAHFGRSGLNMLSYDPAREGALYLFDTDGRKTALNQLRDDVPRVVSGFGDAVQVAHFYQDIYNLTAAHSDDIKAAILGCDDIEVSTKLGGTRRRASTISADDIIKLKAQRSFHFGWK